MKTAVMLLLATLAFVSPAAAQDPPDLSIRPFGMATVQSFAAVDSFDATFGKSTFPFFGGGVQVVIHDRFFAELTASRFKQDGQRAYISGGKAYQLGIPVTTTITPFEVTGGYRFLLRSLPRVRPYGALGAGSYQYEETSSFADAGENVNTRHAGFVVDGGAEFRISRWIGITADVQYSHVTGILGQGGVSQQAGESNLGGVSGRFKFVVGR